MKVPFFNLDYIHKPLKQGFLNSISEIIDGNGYILGKEVSEFEALFGSFCSTKYAIGVGNGLDALKISLKTLNIKSGDEVIVPAHTFIATWLAVSEVGAIPIPVDAYDDTMNINVELIEEAITLKTRAIMPVHMYGQMCDMKAVMDVANKYNLYVIEDFAQSQGATFEDKIAGSWGHINGTSFYPGKNIGALGDGGCITTNDISLFESAKMNRNYGSLIKYQHEIKGVNSRLDSIQASLLNIKLSHLNNWNNERIKLANLYYEKLKHINSIKFQTLHASAKSVYHLFVIRIDNRNELQKYLLEKEIGTIIHYPIPPHLQPAYSDLKHKKGAYPICEKISNSVLSLPLYPGLEETQIDYICESIIDFTLS